MKTKIVFLLSVICIIALQFSCLSFLFGQDTIFLKNPSFEDVPRRGVSGNREINGWKDCGLYLFHEESPPDIHPVADPAWHVDLKAKKGNTYLGLVTRYSDSYESITQALSIPLEAGKCYTLSCYLASFEGYKSPTQRSHYTEEDFSHSVEFMIWGGDDYCIRDEILIHSGPVSNRDWTLYTFEFSPKETYYYITVAAFFEYGYKKPYNGNLLVDGLSPIIEIECK